MSIYMLPIQIAIIMFVLLSVFLIVPWLIYVYRKYGYLSIWASVVAFSFIFYLLSALFLVLLPLPDARNICALQNAETVYYSLKPFYFVTDMINSSKVVWNYPSTYISLLNQSAFLQAVFNFLLLLPFGVYLRYFFRHKQYWKRVLGMGFGLSLFFEITQLTGIYGLYDCPYRLFDVDDLMLNSTGALVGFLIAPILLALFPSRKELLAKGDSIQKSQPISPVAQWLAVLIDFLLIHVSWDLIAGQFLSSEWLYKTIGFLVVYFLLPLLWKGKTIGTSIMRFKLTSSVGNVLPWQALFKRTLALYLPWLLGILFNILTSINMEVGEELYVYHIWMTVVMLIFLVMMWAILLIHMMFVIVKKGSHRFYFDAVADITPRKKL